jgi:hypothetical protein
VTVGGTPLPVSVTVCGLPEALSVSVSVPVRAPLAVGVNVTLIVQLPPAAIVEGESGQLFVCAKSPVLAMPVINKGPVPEFVIITGWGALVVPIF